MYMYMYMYSHLMCALTRACVRTSALYSVENVICWFFLPVYREGRGGRRGGGEREGRVKEGVRVWQQSSTVEGEGGGGEEN